jgi:hypothetical protein
MLALPAEDRWLSHTRAGLAFLLLRRTRFVDVLRHTTEEQINLASGIKVSQAIASQALSPLISASLLHQSTHSKEKILL